MSPAVWMAIVDAWEALGRRIDESFPGGRAAPIADEAALALLRRDLGGLLSGLAAALTRLELDRDACQGVMEPLAMATDERVLVRAPTSLVMFWSHLYCHPSDDGGVVFFQKADALLAAPGAPVVLEAYYFCLSQGFLGQHAAAPDLIEGEGGYCNRLRAAILEAERTPASLPAERPGAAPVPVLQSSIWQAPTWVYVVAGSVLTLALVVAVPLIARACL